MIPDAAAAHQTVSGIAELLLSFQADLGFFSRFTLLTQTMPANTQRVIRRADLSTVLSCDVLPPLQDILPSCVLDVTHHYSLSLPHLLCPILQLQCPPLLLLTKNTLNLFGSIKLFTIFSVPPPRLNHMAHRRNGSVNM